MADVFSPEKRSAVMAAVRGHRNKSTELRLLAILRGCRFTGWRRNHPLPGKPDFAFPKLKLAVFVDGCFWHGCRQHGSMPKSNAEYWLAKVARNKRRDREVGRLLRDKGWEVLRIWEHELSRANEKRLFAKLSRAYFRNQRSNGAE